MSLLEVKTPKLPRRLKVACTMVNGLKSLKIIIPCITLAQSSRIPPDGTERPPSSFTTF